MYMDISRLGKNETVKFAYNELCRYLRMIEPTLLIKEGVAKEYKADASKLWVGISSEFDGYLPEVEDRKLDDGIYIDVKNGAGIITSSPGFRIAWKTLTRECFAPLLTTI